jgi:hypothetical protein
MCGKPAAPKKKEQTIIDNYKKVDYGPLPSLYVGDPVDRQGPSYGTLTPARSGSAIRTLLMSLGGK